MRFSVFALLVLGVGCSPPPAPGPRFIGNNNSTILRGAEFGTGKVPLFPLQKKVKVVASGAAAALSVVDGFLMRDKDSSETGYLVVRVKNIGAEGLCFFKAKNIEWKNPVGAVLTQTNFSFVTGSMGQFTTVATNTCLGAGETGVLTDIKVATSPSTASFSPVSEINLAWELATKCCTDRCQQIFFEHTGSSSYTKEVR